MIIACIKGGFPQFIKFHPIPERLKFRDDDEGGGGPLFVHPVCPADLLPENYEAG